MYRRAVMGDGDGSSAGSTTTIFGATPRSQTKRDTKRTYEYTTTVVL